MALAFQQSACIVSVLCMTIIHLTCECELVTDCSSLVHCIICIARPQPYLRKNIGSQPNFSRIFYLSR